MMALNFLPQLTRLEDLRIASLSIYSGTRSELIYPYSIGELKQLKTLELAGVNLRSLEFLTKCSSLKGLTLNNLPITSISEIGSIRSLEAVSLVDMPVVEISPLTFLPNLKGLYLQRVPARADIITILEDRGTKVQISK